MSRCVNRKQSYASRKRRTTSASINGPETFAQFAEEESIFRESPRVVARVSLSLCFGSDKNILHVSSFQPSDTYACLCISTVFQYLQFALYVTITSCRLQTSLIIDRSRGDSFHCMLYVAPITGQIIS